MVVEIGLAEQSADLLVLGQHSNFVLHTAKQGQFKSKFDVDGLI